MTYKGFTIRFENIDVNRVYRTECDTVGTYWPTFAAAAAYVLTCTRETETMTIDGHTLTLTAQKTQEGARLTVWTDKGEKYEDAGFSGLYDDGRDGLARMLFESLAPLGEAELYPTFARWCEYMDDMGDDVSPRDPETFNRWRRELTDWHRATDGLTADKTLQYLSDHYNI